MTLETARPAETLSALRRALSALRLNQSFVPWRAVDGHLAALAVPCPGAPLRWTAGEPWPSLDSWQRVAADHSLIDQVLPVLEQSGAQERARYLSALSAHTLLPAARHETQLVRHEGAHITVVVTVDRHLTRTVARLTVPQRWVVDAGNGVVDAVVELVEAVLQAGRAPIAGGLALERFGVVHQLTVGTVGPARSGVRGPWLSAVLVRVSRELTRTFIDDPLACDVAVPAADRPVRMSRQRKWAVPQPDRGLCADWLAECGSRNVVYGYRQGARR